MYLKSRNEIWTEVDIFKWGGVVRKFGNIESTL